MKPQVPEGLRVRYLHTQVYETPAGRSLPKPHRATMAVLLRDEPGGISEPVAVGFAVAKEGPAIGERPNGQCKYDQFSRQIGRDVALGRALKNWVQA